MVELAIFCAFSAPVLQLEYMALVVLAMVCLPQALSIAVNTGFILEMRKVGFTLLERKSSYLCLEFFLRIQIFFGFDSSGT